MPYRKRPIRRRRRKAAPRRNTRRLAIRRNPVSKTATVQLKYCQFIALNPGAAGIPATHYYRMNSIYDPDFTGTGHQPMGHDTYETLYNHYYVKSCKTTVYFSSTSAVGTDACIVGMRFDNDTTTTPSGGLNELTEQRSSTWGVLSNRNDKATLRLSKMFNTNRHFGSTAKWNRTGLGADFGTNPSQVGYLQLYAAPIDAAVDAAVINCYVVMTYTVYMTEPKELSLS